LFSEKKYDLLVLLAFAEKIKIFGVCLAKIIEKANKTRVEIYILVSI